MSAKEKVIQAKHAYDTLKEAKRIIDSGKEKLDKFVKKAEKTTDTSKTNKTITKQLKTSDIFCVHCGKASPSHAKFCQYCGKELNRPLYCINCGSKLVASSKFCSNCGNKI